MPKYLLAYRESLAAMPAKPPSPEEMQEVLTVWNAWIDKFRKSGHIVDPGDGLTPAGKLVRPGGIVSDGPFAEAKEVLGGFSVIQAKSFDEALTVAMECPCAHAPGMSVEIREFAGYN